MKLLLRILIFVFSILVVIFMNIIQLPIGIITDIREEVYCAFTDKYTYKYQRTRIYAARFTMRRYLAKILITIQLWYSNKYYRE